MVALEFCQGQFQKSISFPPSILEKKVKVNDEEINIIEFYLE